MVWPAVVGENTQPLAVPAWVKSAAANDDAAIGSVVKNVK
jgi:hypothetical protein